MSRLRNRNLAALALIVITIPLLWWLVIAPQFDAESRSSAPTPDIVVNAGDSVILGGTQWSVKGIVREHFYRTFDGTVHGLPRGTEAVRVTFLRLPQAGENVATADCGVGFLVAGDRRFEATTVRITAADISVAKGPPGTAQLCSQPGDFEVAALAPTGVHFDAAEFYWSPVGDAGSAMNVRFALPANTA